MNEQEHYQDYYDKEKEENQKILKRTKQLLAVALASSLLAGASEKSDKQNFDYKQVQPQVTEQLIDQGIDDYYEPLAEEIAVPQNKIDGHRGRDFLNDDIDLNQENFLQEPEQNEQQTVFEHFEATSYCACEICCGDYAKNRPIDPETGEEIVYGATGVRLTAYNPEHPENISSAAVDPDVIPLGSIFEVYQDDKLLGTFEAVDTGSAIVGGVFDIYEGNDQSAHERAWNRGRIEGLTIKIIKKPEQKNYQIKPIAYVVEPGDSLSGIADKYDINVDDIKNYNPGIKDISYIRVGQKLIIPTKIIDQVEQADSPSGSTTYVVELGDSLSAIAEKYNVSIDDIKKHNPEIKDISYIKVGQKIKIPTKKI